MCLIRSISTDESNTQKIEIPKDLWIDPHILLVQSAHITKNFSFE